MIEKNGGAKFPAEPKLTEAEKELVRAFRAHLHLVMTAAQTGRKADLEQLPRPDLRDYCSRLTYLPGNLLAQEVGRAIGGLFEALNRVQVDCFRAIQQKMVTDPEEFHELEQTQDQLDEGLGLIMRHLWPGLDLRAEYSRNSELLPHVCNILFTEREPRHRPDLID